MFFIVGALIASGLSGPIAKAFGRIRWLIFLEVLSIALGYFYTIKSLTVLYTVRAVTGVIAGTNTSIGFVAISEMLPSSVNGISGLFLYIVSTGFMLVT